MTKLLHSFPHSFPSPFPTLLLRFQLVQVLSVTLMFAWKKYQTHNKTQPQKAPHQSLGFCSEWLCFRQSLWEGVLLQMALRHSTSSQCQVSSEQSEGKEICAQVPQATSDPCPKVPFFPLPWEGGCFILCCQYLFCQSRTLCLAVQGLEGPKCAMSLSLNVSASSQWNHSPLGRCRAASRSLGLATGDLGSPGGCSSGKTLRLSSQVNG